MLMLSSTADYTNPTILEAGIIASLGYVVVFAGLILLMVVVIGIGKLFSAGSKETAADPAPAAPAAPAVTAAPMASAESAAAPGSAGQLKLYDVPPKTAAMLMAIVAHKMGKPLNELRFISIKEVK